MTSAWTNMDGHFLVSTTTAPVAKGAVRYALSSTALDVYGDQTVVAVFDATGARVGYLLGTVIDLKASEVLKSSFVIECFLTRENIDEAVEKFVYNLVGSFLFVLEWCSVKRLYLDASGTKSCVYNVDTKRAGSTAMALMDEDEYWARLNKPLFQHFEVNAHGWFSADLTAHDGVRRLICNHYLDLTTWTVNRHWPREPIAQTSNPAAVFDQLMSRIEASVRILAASGPVTFALTAGIDSRFMLAASRSLSAETGFVTVAAPGAGLDVDRAQEISARLKLNHVVLPCRLASVEQAANWQVRAGHGLSGGNMFTHPSVMALSGSYFVGGLGGEIGRGFLWLKAERDTPLDAEGIVARLKLRPHPVLIERVRAWLSPIAHLDTLLKLDLAYLELRMSSWAFADAYANPVRTEIHPMISRANFEAMLSIPPDMRRDGTVFRAAIERAWPELMTTPINRYGDWRDFWKKMSVVATSPRRVVRKVRQTLLAR